MTLMDQQRNESKRMDKVLHRNAELGVLISVNAKFDAIISTDHVALLTQ